jgi:hypothetical protein
VDRLCRWILERACRIARIGAEHQPLQIGAERQLNIFHGVSRDRRIHERDADGIVSDKASSSVLVADARLAA